MRVENILSVSAHIDTARFPGETWLFDRFVNFAKSLRAVWFQKIECFGPNDLIKVSDQPNKILNATHIALWSVAFRIVLAGSSFGITALCARTMNIQEAFG